MEIGRTAAEAERKERRHEDLSARLCKVRQAPAGRETFSLSAFSYQRRT